MEPAMTTPASPVPGPGRESVAVRARRLAAARRRATALLAAVTVLFLAVTVVGTRGAFMGFVQAGAEAAIVGGVAGWVAETAVFRPPPGPPRPHNTPIVQRQDHVAPTL